MKKLITSLCLAIVLMGCSTTLGHPMTQDELNTQATIVWNLGKGYEASAHTAANYIHCGEAGYVPCLPGWPNPTIVATMRKLDGTAYAALKDAESHVADGTDAASGIALLSTAILGLEAYNTGAIVASGSNH